MQAGDAFAFEARMDAVADCAELVLSWGRHVRTSLKNRWDFFADARGIPA
jgi:hypothetical protein